MLKTIVVPRIVFIKKKIFFYICNIINVFTITFD